MNTNKTLISLVIDRSSSMCSMGNEPYKAILSFIKEQTTGDTYVTALKFDYVCDRFVKPILSTEFTFQESEISPRGTTALYEAIGKSLDYVDNIKKLEDVFPEYKDRLLGNEERIIIPCFKTEKTDWIDL